MPIRYYVVTAKRYQGQRVKSLVTTCYSDPTGIQIATKSYATLQAWHRPMVTKRFIKNLLYSISRAASIDSDCCRLPTTSVLSNKSDKYVPTSFDQQLIPSFSRPHIVQKQGKLKYQGPWWGRPSAGEAGARASIQPSKVLCILEKAPRIFPVRRSMWP